MCERHQEKAGDAHHRLAGAAEQRQHRAAAPADAVEVARAVAQHARQEGEAGPDIAMEGDVER